MTTEHDPALVALSILVCLLASYTTVKLTQRACPASQLTSSTWTLCAGFIAGAGTWATHFVAMLAFHTNAPVEYQVGLTVISILIAVSGAICSFAIADGPQQWRPWLGGACLGADIALMHYTGMAAATFPATEVWNGRVVLASVALAIFFASAAIRVAFLPARAWGTIAGAALLAAAICTLHFVGMSALTLAAIEPQPRSMHSEPVWWLATLIVIVTIMILMTAFAGLRLDQYLTRRIIREQDRLRSLADATFEGILIHVDGVIADVNNSLLRLLRRERTELIGSPVAALVAPGFLLGAVVEEAMEIDLLRSDGSTVSVEILGRAIEYRSNAAAVLAIRDITERRASAARIHRLAFRDTLTDLPNRRSFREQLKSILGRAQPGGSVAVLCVDLNNFGAVNDAFGFPTGDALLRSVASRISGIVRSSDTLSRLGGDEFAIIQENAIQPDSVISLCRRLIEQLNTPITVDGHLIPVSARIGVAFALEGETISDDVLKRAAMALSRAKEGRGGEWRFYEPEMDANMQARHALERDLRQALALNQFQVYYQPLVHVQSARITGFEALVRWLHPERGSVAPALFIALAEELGLINGIGEWVLRQACADAASWPREISVAVNLSAVQFRNIGLAQDIERILTQTRLQPSRLQVEVTESLLLGDEPSVLAILHSLRDLGVRIAMDDFGTGYSSLSYLRRFPFDKLKIDQSFVRGLNGSATSSAIITAVVALGRSLGITVNAEGVETAKELAELRERGCDEVQGFLFSSPVPVTEVSRLLECFGTSSDRLYTMSEA